MVVGNQICRKQSLMWGMQLPWKLLLIMKPGRKALKRWQGRHKEVITVHRCIGSRAENVGAVGDAGDPTPRTVVSFEKNVVFAARRRDMSDLSAVKRLHQEVVTSTATSEEGATLEAVMASHKVEMSTSTREEDRTAKISTSNTSNQRTMNVGIMAAAMMTHRTMISRTSSNKTKKQPLESTNVTLV
jgi:hypothetical protein